MQSQVATEPVIRPKVMRRPAQFAGEQASATPASQAQTQPQLPALYAPPVRYWQEDARFGLALVGIIVGINLLLMVGLSLLGTHTTATATALATTEPTAPATSDAARGAVTIYTQPDSPFSGAELAPASTSLAPLLSTSPADMPIPRAKPLESIGE